MIYHLLIGLISLVALVLTFAIGFSRENRQSSHHYDKSTRKRMRNLVIIYVIATALFVALFALYLR